MILHFSIIVCMIIVIIITTISYYYPIMLYHRDLGRHVVGSAAHACVCIYIYIYTYMYTHTIYTCCYVILYHIV